MRIIGGKWRGRKVTFQEQAQLRPTGDRIRETLFNWLMTDINGSHCLDLFSGSGILAIEALSRGASHVTIIEHHKASAMMISAQLFDLGAASDQYTVLQTDAWQWLEQQKDQFDIVFVDPPFAEEVEETICQKLQENQIAAQRVYLESSRTLEDIVFPVGWTLSRSKTAGGVNYGLLDCK